MDIISFIFFSEWSNLDVAWTSAFSLIVVTSVLGNVMVLKLVFLGILLVITSLVCAPQVP